jgi:hypothetical protein
MEQGKTTGHANLMSLGLAPPPTPLQLQGLHLSHREKKDEERGDGGGSRYCYNGGVIEGGDIPNYNKKARSS